MQPIHEASTNVIVPSLNRRYVNMEPLNVKGANPSFAKVSPLKTPRGDEKVM